MKFSIRSLIAVVVVAGLACATSIALAPKQGSGYSPERVPMNPNCPLRSLPGTATNVNFHYGGIRNPNTFYEFDISKDEFDGWINSLARFKEVKMGTFCRYDPETGPFEWINMLGHMEPTGASYELITSPDDGKHERIGYDTINECCYYHYGSL